MKRKMVSAVTLTLLLMSILTLAFNIQPVKAEPTTWYVDDSGGKDFTRIQDAIYAASPGDTIYVYNGTYYEHIYIFSGSLTIVGESKYGTIIDGMGSGEAVWITSCSSSLPGVKFTGFTVRNAEKGISIYGASCNNIIIDNIISDSTIGDPNNWGGGIYLDHSNNNTIADNIISNTTEIGIWHHYSSHNTEVRNIISQNDKLELPSTNGIHVGDYSHDNAILNNIISKSLVGIYAGTLAYQNTYAGNTIENLTSYECGINIWGPDNNIVDNLITGMSYVGIQLNSISSDGLYGVPNACANNVVSRNVISNSTFGINLILTAFSNTVVGNNVSNNGLGIFISDSDNNTIRDNFVSNNDYGILLFSSNNTKVYHNNFIDNTDQTLLSEAINTTWDDGYPSGGNYWSNHAGVDTDGDGIGDTPYIIDADNQDRYPLMAPINMFDAGTWNGTSYSVDVVSNSTVSDFYFNPYEGAFLEFKVTGEAGTSGFCRVTIPKGLLWTEDGWVVLVDDEPVDYSQIQDENFTYLYFTYIHSTHEIQIIGTHVIVPPPLTYSLTITTTIGGTTDPAPGTYSYTANSPVQITAIPETNYLFEYWELDDVNVGSANPYSVTMDKNHTLKAVFSLIPPPLQASISPLSASILVGQSVTFTSTVSGGCTPCSYQWYLNGAPVSGATSSTWTFTPTTTGHYSVYLNVTDSVSQTAKSNEASVTVAPPLSVSIAPTSVSILLGQSVTFTSTVSGGYTPYSYQWYLNGNPVSGATSNTWTFTPTTSGIYYVHLKVTDAKGNTAQSDPARITVATVPVGGYSIPIQVPTKTEPIIPYIALIATLTAILTKLRPKTKRKR